MQEGVGGDGTSGMKCVTLTLTIPSWRVDLYKLDQHDQLNLSINDDDDTPNANEIIIQNEIVRPGPCEVVPLLRFQVFYICL